MLIESDPVEAVMQQDLVASRILPASRFSMGSTGFCSYLTATICLLQRGSLQYVGKSFELRAVTPPLRPIDLLAFIGHVAYINIHIKRRCII